MAVVLLLVMAAVLMLLHVFLMMVACSGCRDLACDGYHGRTLASSASLLCCQDSSQWIEILWWWCLLCLFAGDARVLVVLAMVLVFDFVLVLLVML